MLITSDHLLAFQSPKRHGGLRQAEKEMGVRRGDLIERRKALATSLGKKLFTGNGPGWKLTADGVTLDAWIDSFPGGVALAADELNTRGWDAVQPTSSATGAQSASKEAAGPPPEETLEPSAASLPHRRIVVQLPEHPKLADLVKSAVARLCSVAGTFHFKHCEPWPLAIEGLLTCDKDKNFEVDIAFGWSPAEKPEGYPPALTAQRLMPDNFDHAIERTVFWHRVLPRWLQRKRASIIELRKRPVVVHGRYYQTALHEHVNWLAGRKWMIETDEPSYQQELNAWTLASRFSTVVCPGEMIRPLDIIGLKAGFDVVYRANEHRATALAIIAGMVGRFSKNTGIAASPVRAKFIHSPSAQDLQKV